MKRATAYRALPGVTAHSKSSNFPERQGSFSKPKLPAMIVVPSVDDLLMPIETVKSAVKLPDDSSRALIVVPSVDDLLSPVESAFKLPDKCVRFAEDEYNLESKPVHGYRTIRHLGTGAFGSVFLVERGNPRERLAMKVFSKGRLRKKRQFFGGLTGQGMKVKTDLDTVYTEIALLKKVNHNNCVRLQEVIDDGDMFGEIRLVLEYMHGGATMEWDVTTRTFRSPITGGVLPEATAGSYVCDTMLGLKYLHANFVAHRDIKPQNILVSKQGVAKISDFGVSTRMDKRFLVSSTQGTPPFWSPEMCTTGWHGHDGRKADVWAMGVSLWAFVFGTTPFSSRDGDVSSLMEVITRGRFEMPRTYVVGVKCRTFLCKLLSKDLRRRPLAHEAIRDPWIVSTTGFLPLTSRS
eukprot:TRINITY_DN17518_c0_g1_i1.p1 TRINITY_DN17518_c0_g1~~TRINITY_DN17518_c0_g1_i1.p1  ORF type:complete len:407 (-),score=52.89 TRINITY_DN17518_c0_g1_i1:50-1270(-)